MPLHYNNYYNFGQSKGHKWQIKHSALFWSFYDSEPIFKCLMTFTIEFNI